ncbi:SDR family NAD(P)-dependent oxidoreductase [Alteromonas aestuariivivens]|uniref:SDR family NAD(P)-dependent oxidoreductase n=1 Tax=Alteromonas aestuariivivens TaxID=1938339 RepID=A0A3D8MB62_9ALTE|nr:SDR family oxidoreductase [Alteromonas aestuariivivens]RDV27512.1 SDR family NAD(P)-dependent oxidoreductase [Alteromonas aestuariivivens]
MSHLYDLTNKVAVVTGGGKGLGKTLAEYLLNQGMKVAICGRTQKHIDETVAEFSQTHPGNIIGRVCDVSQAAQVEAFIDAVIGEFGPVQVLINNSGFGKETLVWETAEQDWDEVMNTNVKGTYLMCKSVVPHMIESREGYIINIASQAALNGYANAGVYCASKFAMVGLGKALQEEVRQYGIHVHSLNPALIQSQKQPQDAVDNGLIQNEDLASMVLYLLQQPRRLKIDNIGMWGF